MKKVNSKQNLHVKRMANQVPTQATATLLNSARISPSNNSSVSLHSGSQNNTLTNLTRNTGGKAKTLKRGVAGTIMPRLGGAGSPHSKSVPQKFNSYQSGFEFSAVSLDNNALVDVACEIIFEMYINMVKAKKVSRREDLRRAIRQFVLAVQYKYTASAYHCFTHAVDVTQLMYTFLTTYFMKRVSKVEAFYLVVVSLCHDIAHPGAGTMSLRGFGVVDQEKSLEDFHIDQTLDLIENGLFGNQPLDLFTETYMKRAQIEELKEYARKLIDATDIMKNKKYMEEAQAVKVGSKDMLPMEYLAILIKASDLANVVREFKDSGEWAERLKVEIRGEARLKEAVSLSPDIVAFTEAMETPEKMKRIWTTLQSFQKQVKEEENDTFTQDLKTPTMDFMQAVGGPLGQVLALLDKKAGSDYSKRMRHNLESWRMS